MFRKLKSAAILLAVAPATATLSAAEGVRGWYEVGGTTIQTAAIETFGSEQLTENHVKFDPGVRASVGLGMELTRYLALEVEGGFHYNSISSIDGASADSGNLYQVPVLGNLVLHFPNRTRLEPVLGAGVGAAFSILDANNITIGATRFSGTEETWSLAYQGYAGLLYQFRPDMGLGVTYHYLRSDGPTWNDGAGNDIKFNRVINHSLSVAFSFRF